MKIVTHSTDCKHQIQQSFSNGANEGNFIMVKIQVELTDGTNEEFEVDDEQTELALTSIETTLE